jgi:predicted CXXCH cytochrome family protein
MMIVFVPLFADDNLADLKDNQCLNCHTELEILPEGFNEHDIHLQPGLSCSGCHGGDPTQSDVELAKAAGTGFRGAPEKKNIPGLCGRCHGNIKIMREFQPRIATDQVEQYYTSVHGQKLLQGDQKVADCISCHTAHGVLPAKDSRSAVYPLNIPSTCNTCHGDAEYMQGYKIPTDQFEKFSQSVHGKMLLEERDTGSPACNDCHGNHGAIPPGVSSISHVCGTCHVNNMNYFTESKMGEAFADQELHACEECHGNHEVQKTSDEMLSIGEESLCIDCHEDDTGYETAQEIYSQLSNFVAIYDSTSLVKKEVQRIGMNDTEIGFLLQDAKQRLIESRTLVHTFDPMKVGEKTEEGTAITQEALLLAEQEISDYHTRRRGFGIATIMITILVVALFFKIRDMEGEQ